MATRHRAASSGSIISPVSVILRKALRSAMSARLVLILLASLIGHRVVAEEVCRYSGPTDYSGVATVETRASKTSRGMMIDATARVNARSLGIIDWRYLYQEIGIWRDGELQEIGVNQRYSVLGSIRRQQWDVFHRTPEGMQAYRVQAKTLVDFQKNHPNFARHWDPASFGQPWLPDYPTAQPERRADLDLPAASMPHGLGAPLLMAFFWARWAGERETTVPLFLPGFKRDARINVTVVPGTDGKLTHLHASVRHPRLSETNISTGDAWVSADHHLMRVTFDAHAQHGSAHGALNLVGCQGDPPSP
jgi:hypothetical protein